MPRIFSLLLFLLATVCYAEDWVYTGSVKALVPVSSEIGEGWSRSVVRIVNEANELKHLFNAAADDADSGVTTHYERFRQANHIREFADVDFYFEDPDQGQQVYQVVVLLFENQEALNQYWASAHPEQREVPVFTAMDDAYQCCIFRLQNVYVRTASLGEAAECERISGVVLNQIQNERARFKRSKGKD